MDDGWVGGSGLGRAADAVGDGGGFRGCANVVDAEDVGSGENGCYVGGGGGVDAVTHVGLGFAKQDSQGGALSECVGEEAFAGNSREDGLIELVQLIEMGEQGVVFVEALAEAEAWVEDDSVALDTGGSGSAETLG